ncbi:putative NAD-specific glutamate dehydrogenase encoded in antisense gene pair with dnaKJ [Burkholderia pseudomallei 1710b]|uniref:Putative NAD-specific glutamate dehydrogenase encoded in antisense gene pair with dnaKJ n=1 Tax=Burkholderia pseudomallei (strain 1710b) TaxID=320372 RepID=Q3JP11_BURP1|nr:putative NAD-specific glutamate dehydrogenase encoded in antisense gene pair with dnaKJ [Burkholderia pseudomallei 1710b]
MIRPFGSEETDPGKPRRAPPIEAPDAVDRHPASVLLHFLEVGIDDVVGRLRAALRRRTFGCRPGRARGACLLRLHVGVHLLAELLRRRRNRFDLRVDRRLVARRVLQHVLELLERRFDLLLLARLQLVAVLGERLLRAVHERIALVAGFGELTQLVVFRRVRFRVLHHLLDLGFGQARVRLDRDLVFLAGRLVLRADVQDAVRVDVEGHFDLRHAARRGRDALEVELAEQLVARRHLAFALEHLDRHGALVVVRRRIHLSVLRRDRRVLVDHLRHHAAERLDAERQRRHVEQQHVLAVARKHLALDRRAHRDGFVRVHVAARLLAEEFLHLLLHLRHAGLAADEDHVVDVRHLDARVLDRGAARLDRALDQILDERLELRARDLQVQVLRARRVGRDVRQVDFGLLARRQLDLRLLGRFLQALQREHVLREIDALLLLEFADDVIDDALVEVLAAEERVAVGRQHFELHFAVDVRDLDDRHVERAAAEVIHRDLAIALLGLVEAERERGRGRLVDDPLDFEARDAPRVLRRLALAVVEVRRHRDHGFRDRLAEVVFGRLLHLAQHFGRHLRRGELLAVRLDPRVAVVRLDDRVRHQADVLLDFLLFETAADQALDREQRVLRVRHRLALGGRADEHFVVVHVRDDRRRRARAFRILDDLDLVAFHDRDARVRGAEVNTDDLSHFS